MTLFDVRNVGKDFPQPHGKVTAVDGVALEIGSGELVVLTGESGSGKTTLLSLLAGMDVPTRGDVVFDGQALGALSEGGRSRLRMASMGFVFQDFLLIRHLSALENVRLPSALSGGWATPGDARRLLLRMGLGERQHHRPDQLSRGEMQRVALARALINQPKAVFADEPTANLDRRNADAVCQLLRDLCDEGVTVIVATHNTRLFNGAGRRIGLMDGRVIEAGR